MIFKVNYKVSRRIIEFFIFTKRGKNKGLQSFIATRQSFLGKIVKIGKYIWDENFWSRYSMGGGTLKYIEDQCLISQLKHLCNVWPPRNIYKRN